jgi:hypothetical protein
MRTGCHAGGVPVLPILAFFCGSCGKNGLRPVGVQGGDLIWGSGGRAFRSPFVSAVHLPLAALRLRGFFLLAFCGQTTKAKPRRGTAAKIERRRKRGSGCGATRAGCRCSQSLRSSVALAARTVCVPLGRKAGTCSGDLGECFSLSIPFGSPSPLGGFEASRLFPSGLLRADNESKAAKPRRGTAAKIERRRKRGSGCGATRAEWWYFRFLRSSVALAARTVCVRLGLGPCLAHRTAGLPWVAPLGRRVWTCPRVSQIEWFRRASS